MRLSLLRFGGTHGCVVTRDKRVAAHTLIHGGLGVEIAIAFVIRGRCLFRDRKIPVGISLT